jgi:phosphoribosylformylglycinamidine cyclo-ligase
LKRFNPEQKAKQTSRAGGNPVRAFAHITGGGFIDNIPRVLPGNCDVVIRKGSWEMLPIFQLIAERGGVPEAELYQVFNMGIGMVTIVANERAQDVLNFINANGHRAWVIGEVVAGSGQSRVE